MVVPTVARPEEPAQKIRGYVCYRTGGAAYKIAWVHESARGVYIGMYGERRSAHFSYHSDGNCHFKEGSKSMGDFKRDPIEQVHECSAVVAWTQRIDLETVRRVGDRYRPDPNSSVAIFLEEAMFAENPWISMLLLLVPRSDEDRFANEFIDRLNADRFLHVTSVLFDLRHFPNHRLGMIFHRPPAGAEKAGLVEQRYQ